jgi:hypothetical protein
MQKSTIASSFLATGIYPFDPFVVKRVQAASEEEDPFTIITPVDIIDPAVSQWTDYVKHLLAKDGKLPEEIAYIMSKICIQSK